MPFTDLSKEQWANLGLTALSALYLFFLSFHLIVNKPFRYVGQDMVVYIATAGIARDHGVAAAYDLALQEQYQRRLYASQGNDWLAATTPMAYLPIFVIGLIPLSFLEPFTAYIVWTLFNLTILIFYILRLLKELDIGARPRIALCLMAALPVFFTLLFGQLSVWLGICVGESFRAFRKHQDVRAGAWLAGLFLKPQILILLIPGLVLARKYRIVFWAGAIGLGLIAISTLLVGKEVMISLLGLWMGSARPDSLPTFAPEMMMNWRRLALELAVMWPNSDWTGVVTLMGILVTAGAALGMWLSRQQMTLEHLDLMWLGTLAGTFAVTWHSHIHMGVPLVILIAFIWAEKRELPPVLMAWLYLPPIFFLATSFAHGTDVATAKIGAAMLVLNVVVTGWCAYSIFEAERAPAKRLASIGDTP